MAARAMADLSALTYFPTKAFGLMNRVGLCDGSFDDPTVAMLLAAISDPVASVVAIWLSKEKSGNDMR